MSSSMWRNAVHVPSMARRHERSLQQHHPADGHTTKTKLVDLGEEGFEFLGFHFHKRRVGKTGKLLPYFWPGQKAMSAVRNKIRQIAGYRQKRVPMEKLVSDLNTVK